MPNKQTKQKSELQIATEQAKSGLISVAGISDYSMPSNLCTLNTIIPAPLQEMMKSQFRTVGLDFDISQLVLSKDNKSAIKQIRDTVELIKNSQSLLPQLKQALVAASNASVKQSQFNRDVAVTMLQNQAKIDNAQADVLISLAGYAKKRNAIELRLQTKVNKYKAKAEASTNRINKTYSAEIAYINSASDIIADIAIANIQAKETRLQNSANKKMKSAEYKNLDA